MVDVYRVYGVVVYCSTPPLVICDYVDLSNTPDKLYRALFMSHRKEGWEPWKEAGPSCVRLAQGDV